LEFGNFRKYNFLNRNSLLRIVVISDALLQLYVDEKFDTSKFLIAHDGANLDIKESKDESPKYNDGMIHIGYVGHLYKGRGIDLILNMAKQRGELLFHIVGGLDEDIKYWEGIASKRKIKNVIFEGYMQHKEAASLRKKFDILLAPYEQKVRVAGNTGDTSKWMSPLKIFEYMSDKKPILVSDLLVLHEVLENEYNCLFCKVNDLDDWLKKLDILIRDKKLSDKISKNAYNDLKEKYTWDKRAKAVIYKV
jgi:glycosyltransferase involved in cell wall biosynthesis